VLGNGEDVPRRASLAPWLGGTDFRDADGFIDCSQGGCSTLQIFVGVTFGIGALLLLAIAVIALAAAAAGRSRSSELR
jgi:hypothetical protein